MSPFYWFAPGGALTLTNNYLSIIQTHAKRTRYATFKPAEALKLICAHADMDGGDFEHRFNPGYPLLQYISGHAGLPRDASPSGDIYFFAEKHIIGDATKEREKWNGFGGIDFSQLFQDWMEDDIYTVIRMQTAPDERLFTGQTSGILVKLYVKADMSIPRSIVMSSTRPEVVKPYAIFMPQKADLSVDLVSPISQILAHHLAEKEMPPPPRN